METYSTKPMTHVRLRYVEVGEGLGGQRLTSLLERGRPGGPKKLTLSDGRLLSPVSKAWGAGWGKATEALTLDGGDSLQEGEALALARAMEAGHLASLRELRMPQPCINRALWTPVWSALGKGCCPALDALELTLSEGLVQAWEAREGLGLGRCAGLKEVAVVHWSPAQHLASLLQLESSRGLQQLHVTDLNEGSDQVIAEWMMSTRAPQLRHLSLHGEEDEDEDAELAAVLDGLAQGAAPALEVLELRNVVLGEVGTRALGAAVQAGKALRSLQRLMLDHAEAADNMATFLDCLTGTPALPCLRELRVIDRQARDRDEASSLVRTLVRVLGSHALPCLEVLHLEGLELGIQSLALVGEAMRKRPQEVTSLQTVTLAGRLSHRVATDSSSLEAGAIALASMVECRGDRSLQRLRLLLNDMFDLDVEVLATALRAGWGAQLEDVEMVFPHMGSKGVEALCGALVAGACPRLRRLALSCNYGTMKRLPEEAYLAKMLSGRAACSGTLRELDLSQTSLYPEDILQVAAALSEPTAARLHALRLRSRGPGIQDLLALMDALSQGGRAGATLRHLELQGAAEMHVAARTFEEALERGCCPQLQTLQLRGPRDRPGSLRAYQSEALRRRREQERAW